MIDPTKFDARGFYDAMRESKSLLVRREDLRWIETFAEPDRPVEALLAFGCAVQHTPHLMLEATAVFDVLGIDYVAVTGRQFCCGRPFQRLGGSDEAADRISAKSYERFVRYQPQTTVQWCGACTIQYQDVISKQTDAPFDVVHVTRYVAERLRELGDAVPFKYEVPTRFAIHAHDGHPQQRTDLSYILEILEMIPGVDYAGAIQPPSAGSPCDLTGPTAVSVLNTLDSTQYRLAVAELEGQARALRADTVVTAYHKCQMEWSKFSSRRLGVREWMSVLAEALGVGYADRFTTYWHLGDPAEIVERARPEWQSWGLTEQEALEAATRHFVPRYAADVHHCDCGGAGCGSRSGQQLRPTAPVAGK
jgi:hypothetical protein